jgi:hypothetical protein
VALTHLKLLVGIIVVSAPAFANAKCFTTIHEVKANDVHTRWRETTENDGKPMTISIDKESAVSSIRLRRSVNCG